MYPVPTPSRVVELATGLSPPGAADSYFHAIRWTEGPYINTPIDTFADLPYTPSNRKATAGKAVATTRRVFLGLRLCSSLIGDWGSFSAPHGVSMDLRNKDYSG